MTEEEAAAKLLEITPSSAELRQLAAKFPPPVEWFDDDLEPPPYNTETVLYRDGRLVAKGVES